MGGPDGRSRPTVGHLHFIDKEAFNLRVPTATSQFFFVLIYYLLFFFISSSSSCVYRPLNYRMTCCVSPTVVDLVGFRSCAHFLRFTCYPPDPPTRFNFRTYHVCLFFLPCLCLSLLLFVGCSLSLYFYLLFRLLSIPRIPCRCCDEYILTRTKSTSTSLQMSD